MDASVIIRGVTYNLAVKWSEDMFCKLWQSNTKILGTLLVDRDKEMKADWEELQKSLPKKAKAE
jgi:hypothetical protein